MYLNYEKWTFIHCRVGGGAEVPTNDMENGIAFLDVGEEGVSQTGSLTGTPDETSDVDHIEEGGHFAETTSTSESVVRMAKTNHVAATTI